MYTLLLRNEQLYLRAQRVPEDTHDLVQWWWPRFSIVRFVNMILAILTDDQGYIGIAQLMQFVRLLDDAVRSFPHFLSRFSHRTGRHASKVLL
jgi:hypothetical protein